MGHATKYIVSFIFDRGEVGKPPRSMYIFSAGTKLYLTPDITKARRFVSFACVVDHTADPNTVTFLAAGTFMQLIEDVEDYKDLDNFNVRFSIATEDDPDTEVIGKTLNRGGALTDLILGCVPEGFEDGVIIIEEGSAGAPEIPDTSVNTDMTAYSLPFDRDIPLMDRENYIAAITDVIVDGEPFAYGPDWRADENRIVLGNVPSHEILQTARTIDVVIKATGYPDQTVQLEITGGICNDIFITTQPDPSNINRNQFATQPVILIQDQYGNGANGFVTASALDTDSPAWSLTGTYGRGAVNGVVAYTDLAPNNVLNTSDAHILFIEGNSGKSVLSDPFHLPGF